MKKRCPWVGTDNLYIEYHDKEWGVPVFDDRKMFEFLILEGMQAGLSWLTILKKRENFREAFDNFDPVKIANYDRDKINELLSNKRIIRNKLKIDAAVNNARAFLKLKEKERSFSEFLWQFVDKKPIQNSWRKIDQLPIRTEISEKMSRELKKRGFKFTGPTICYAHMQAVGMVNDHLVDCFRYKELKL